MDIPGDTPQTRPPGKTSSSETSDYMNPNNGTNIDHARTIPERYLVTSPPAVKSLYEIWKPSISPEEDAASNKYSVARRKSDSRQPTGSTTVTASWRDWQPHHSLFPDQEHTRDYDRHDKFNRASTKPNREEFPGSVRHPVWVPAGRDHQPSLSEGWTQTLSVASPNDNNDLQRPPISSSASSRPKPPRPNNVHPARASNLDRERIILGRRLTSSPPIVGSLHEIWKPSIPMEEESAASNKHHPVGRRNSTVSKRATGPVGNIFPTGVGIFPGRVDDEQGNLELSPVDKEGEDKEKLYPSAPITAGIAIATNVSRLPPGSLIFGTVESSTPGGAPLRTRSSPRSLSRSPPSLSTPSLPSHSIRRSRSHSLSPPPSSSSPSLRSRSPPPLGSLRSRRGTTNSAQLPRSPSPALPPPITVSQQPPCLHTPSLTSRELPSTESLTEPLPIPATITVDTSPAAEEACRVMATILNNKSQYRTLLGLRHEKAQNLLSLMQKMVDHQNTPADLRRSIIIAMIRLCRSSNVYPQCLTLQQKVRYDTKAVAGGHFGEIWKGYFEGSCVSLKVAKIYHHTQIEHLLKCFTREAILWSQLEHLNVLPFYGLYRWGDHESRVCLISPWMDNGNVSEYISANPEIARLPLVCEVLAGLEYLHENSVVHGDIKGANILVSSSGRACLADFGLSSVMDAEILRWTSIPTVTPTGGTIRWEAPELLEDSEGGGAQRPTFSSDVYATASVMYEILTGQIPYHEFPREATVMYKVMKGIKPTKPPPEPELELSDEIWGTMEECWHGDPNKRPTVKQVSEKLQNAPPPQLTVRRMVLSKKGEQHDQLLPTPRTFRNAIQGQDSHFSQAELGLLRGLVTE